MTREEHYDLVKRCANDILFFGKQITPQDFYYESPYFHEEIAELLINPSIKQLTIQAPRGTGKSTLCILTILNHIIFDENDKVIVIQSKTRKEALKRLRTIKDILEYNEKFIELFGKVSSKEAAIWREDEIKFKFDGSDVYICALGTGMPMRGILEGGTRVTLYYLDDPEDEDNTKTEDSLEFNFSKFLGNLFGLDKRFGRCIVVGTPITANCIVDRLDGASDWVSRKYPAVGRFIDGNYDEDSQEILWKEMYNAEWLANKKQALLEQGMLYKFYTDYCCTIRGDDEAIFRKEYLQYYDGELEIINDKPFLKVTRENFQDIEPKLIPLSINIGVDPASSLNRTADYPVIFPVGMDIDENLYCLPYTRERMTATEFVDRIISMYVKLKANRCTIETTGAQEGLREIIDRERRKRNIEILGIRREEGVKPSEEKKQRLREGLHDFFYHKKVWIKENMFEFKSELLGFPRGLKHDDLLDGFYYATRKIHTPYHTISDTKRTTIPKRYWRNQLETTAWAN
jgi:hypothetical protein